MVALEIWTNANGAVLLRDIATGECRELKEVRSVVFVDGSAFPLPKERDASETTAVRTLAGQVLKVG